MQRSGHSFKAVPHPSHTEQYAEAVYYLRAGLKGGMSWGGGEIDGGKKREKKGQGGVVADLRAG